MNSIVGGRDLCGKARKLAVWSPHLYTCVTSPPERAGIVSSAVRKESIPRRWSRRAGDRFLPAFRTPSGVPDSVTVGRTHDNIVRAGSKIIGARYHFVPVICIEQAARRDG